MHGHTYRIVNLIVTTSKIVDFSLIKKIVNSPDHLIFAPEKHRYFWEAVQKLREQYKDEDLPQFRCHYMDIEETTVEAIAKNFREMILAIDGVEEVEFELYETPTQCAIIDNEV